VLGYIGIAGFRAAARRRRWSAPRDDEPLKSVVIYLILVGIPIAGVFGVLRVGRHITPPPYVGGTWQLAMTPDSLCHSTTQADSLLMTVSQSGPHLSVILKGTAETRLSGRAYGAHFRVAGSEQVLHASVKRGENRIRGILVGLPCSAARRTLIQGKRLLAPNQTEAH
jgi:hypothetical protein